MSVPIDDPIRSQLRQTGEWLIALSELQDIPPNALSGGGLPPPNPLHLQHGRSDEPLFTWLAAEEYTERARRRHFFDTDLFAEPAWDILLDLYGAQMAGRNISITSCCTAAQVPPTTALRWIEQMSESGLLVREKDPDDLRRNWIRLSDTAHIAMKDYFQHRARKRLGPHIGVGGAGLVKKSS